MIAMQIERHWSLYSSPELTLKKLQMIATANVSPVYKVRWLQWMNTSAPTREARRFPPRPVNEDKLMQFVVNAGSYAGVGSLEFRLDYLLFSWGGMVYHSTAASHLHSLTI